MPLADQRCCVELHPFHAYGLDGRQIRGGARPWLLEGRTRKLDVLPSRREWLNDRHKLLRGMQNCLLPKERQAGWDGEMAQWLGTLATASEDPGLVSSTHMEAYNHS